MENSNIFKKPAEVFFCPVNPFPALAYFPELKVVEHVGVTMRSNMTIDVDHLPRNGYARSHYNPEDYGKKFCIFKSDMIPFWQSVFPDEQKLYTVFHIQTGEVRLATVSMESNGYGVMYVLGYADNGEEKRYARSDYEVEFVLLED